MTEASTKGYFSTGEAAALCAVTPDTVLKWIKAGKIRAGRTPGGHHRIPHAALLPLMRPNGETIRLLGGEGASFQYCWEFNSRFGRLPDGCRDCIVYRSRTGRCYQMSKLPAEAGHARLFCRDSCETCEYFQMIRYHRSTVLVVTDQDPFKAALEHEAEGLELNLQVTDCEYRCSMMVEKLRPDYVVVDCGFGPERSRDLVELVRNDPRVPFVRIVLAGSSAERPQECDNFVFAFIERPFTASMLGDLIDGARETPRDPFPEPPGRS